MGKIFSGTRGTPEDEAHQDLSCEEKGHIGFVLYSINLGSKPSFCICKKKSVVIKLILNDKYILASFPGFLFCLCNKKANIYIEFRVLRKKRKMGKLEV